MYKRLAAYYARRIDALAPGLQRATTPLLGVLGRGFTAAVIGTFLARILATVAGILTVRYFDGPALYGQYATITTTMALMASLLGLGFDTWLLREGGRDSAALAHNTRRVLTIKLIAAGLLMLGLTIAWSQSALSWLLIVGMLGVICESYIRTGYAVLRALSRNRTVAIFQSLAAGLAVVLIGILLVWPPSVPSLVIGQMVVSVTMLAIVAVALRRHWLVGGGGRLDLRAAIGGASFFLIADVLATIYSQASVAMLAIYTSDVAVGTFRSALNLISMGYLAPLMLFNVALPLLSRPNLSARERNQTIGAMAAGATLYGLVVMLGIWLLGGPIIHLIYGAKYDAALPLLIEMSIMPLFKALSFVAVTVMLAHNAQRLRVIVQSAVVTLSLGGGLLIIPRYGLAGATWLAVAVEGTLCLLYVYSAYRTLRQARP